MIMRLRFGRRQLPLSELLPSASAHGRFSKPLRLFGAERTEAERVPLELLTAGRGNPPHPEHREGEPRSLLRRDARQMVR
jgi:hypothetical protein